MPVSKINPAVPKFIRPKTHKDCLQNIILVASKVFKFIKIYDVPLVSVSICAFCYLGGIHILSSMLLSLALGSVFGVLKTRYIHKKTKDLINSSTTNKEAMIQAIKDNNLHVIKILRFRLSLVEEVDCVCFAIETNKYEVVQFFFKNNAMIKVDNWDYRKKVFETIGRSGNLHFLEIANKDVGDYDKNVNQQHLILGICQSNNLKLLIEQLAKIDKKAFEQNDNSFILKEWMALCISTNKPSFYKEILRFYMNNHLLLDDEHKQELLVAIIPTTTCLLVQTVIQDLELDLHWNDPHDFSRRLRPIELAAKHDRLDLIELFISEQALGDRRVPIDQQINTNKTPFLVATEYGSKKVFDYLSAREEVQKDRVCEGGNNAFHIILASNKFDDKHIKDQLYFINKLFDLNIDVNHENLHGGKCISNLFIGRTEFTKKDYQLWCAMIDKGFDPIENNRDTRLSEEDRVNAYSYIYTSYEKRISFLNFALKDAINSKRRREDIYNLIKFSIIQPVVVPLRDSCRHSSEAFKRQLPFIDYELQKYKEKFPDNVFLDQICQQIKDETLQDLLAYSYDQPNQEAGLVALHLVNQYNVQVKQRTNTEEDTEIYKFAVLAHQSKRNEILNILDHEVQTSLKPDKYGSKKTFPTSVFKIVESYL